MDSLEQSQRIHDEIARAWASEGNHREQIGFNRGQEYIAVQAVMQAAEHFAQVLDLYDSLWQWGDGYGSWVTQIFEESLAKFGFEREPAQPKTNRANRRKPVSPGKIVRAMQRSDGMCIACGTTENLQVDHIIPVSRGGSNDDENLQMLCRSCNASKRDKTMQEWQGDAA